MFRFVSKLANKKIFWILCNQLLRSATSIGANIYEARAAASKRDFIKYYEIALKSANETIYWLKLLLEIDLEETDEVKELLKASLELGNLLGASIKSLKTS